MKTFKLYLVVNFFLFVLLISCGPPKTNQEEGITDVSDTLTAAPEISEEESATAEDYYSLTFMEFCETYGLNSLAAALEASGLADSLQGQSFTIFAPSDAAFDELPDETLTEFMMPENAGELRELLKYHIFPGTLSSVDLTEGLTVTTLTGEELVIHVEETGIIVNSNSRILDADLQTQNSLVHVINDVLFPPRETM